MFRSPSQTVFVLSWFALLAAAAVLATTLSASADEKEPGQGELRHVVLVQFKKDVSKEQIQEVEKQFGEMRNKIDVIAGFEWGTNVSVENLAQGFTHCFIVTFKDAKARDHYLPHPVHEEFKKLALPRVEKVLVVDFYVQK
jgi:hypothetical protein